jgi:hypothetical protein
MSDHLKTLFSKKDNFSLYNPSVFYKGFRDRVFALSWSKSLDIHPGRVIAFVYERGSDAGDTCYSLVNIAGGIEGIEGGPSASIYYSDGGGIIGSRQHLDVSSMSQELIDYSEKFIPLLDKRCDFPLPSPAMVRVYVIQGPKDPKDLKGTDMRVYSAEYPEDDISMLDHQLYPLFLKANELISLIESKVSK